MKRKRFIKLMMACGFSRNVAAMLATQVSRYGSYAVMHYRLTYAGSLSAEWREAHEIMAESCACVTEALQTFGKRAREVLNE